VRLRLNAPTAPDISDVTTWMAMPHVKKEGEVGPYEKLRFGTPGPLWPPWIKSLVGGCTNRSRGLRCGLKYGPNLSWRRYRGKEIIETQSKTTNYVFVEVSYTLRHTRIPPRGYVAECCV
jgi:hypothetical protein